MLLNLLHSRLSVERVLDSSELVHPGEVVDRLSGVLGSTGETEGAGSVEGDGSSDLSGGGGLGALQGGLFGGLGLDILGLGSGCGERQLAGCPVDRHFLWLGLGLNSATSSSFIPDRSISLSQLLSFFPRVILRTCLSVCTLFSHIRQICVAYFCVPILVLAMSTKLLLTLSGSLRRGHFWRCLLVDVSKMKVEKAKEIRNSQA